MVLSLRSKIVCYEKVDYQIDIFSHYFFNHLDTLLTNRRAVQSGRHKDMITPIRIKRPVEWKPMFSNTVNRLIWGGDGIAPILPSQRKTEFDQIKTDLLLSQEIGKDN